MTTHNSHTQLTHVTPEHPMTLGPLFRGDGAMKLPWTKELRARREVKTLYSSYNLDAVQTTSELIAHVEQITGVPISIEALPADFPRTLTGYIQLQRNGLASIHLPAESGVYPAHICHHEIGHILMWHQVSASGHAAPASVLSCSNDPYLEYVVELFAHRLSSRLLRIRTPHIERLLG